MTWKVDLQVSGRLWHTDPQAVSAALTDGVRDLLQLGETAVVEQLYPGHGLVTGHYRRSIHGVMRSRLHGEVNDSGVVYGPWLEGVSSRNERSRFKGYAMFRRARERVEKAAHTTITKALRRHGIGGG